MKGKWGSGPEGVDDLSFHTYGEFSLPSPPLPPPLPKNYVHVGRGSNEPGWIHGRTVADGWAGAVMQKQLAIQQGWIHGYPSRVRVSRGCN